MNRQIINSLLLFSTAVIWGTAYVAQSVGMENVEPLTFNAIRCLIGGVFLIPCIVFLNKFSNNKKENEIRLTKQENDKEYINKLIFGSVLCGIVFTIASNLQGYGVKFTTVGKAGFVTSSYIVIVPLLGLFLKKKVSKKIWLAVIIALSGLYSLCMNESLTINIGDVLVMLGAFMFSIHILVIDHYAPQVNGVIMSCIQFLICGVLTLIPAIIFEKWNFDALISSIGPLLYTGIVSCGIAYTFQILGQTDMNPTIASLILSLESCVSVIAGWILLGEVLSKREILGCILMFLAIIIAQLPQHKYDQLTSS